MSEREEGAKSSRRLNLRTRENMGRGNRQENPYRQDDEIVLRQTVAVVVRISSGVRSFLSVTG